MDLHANKDIKITRSSLLDDPIDINNTVNFTKVTNDNNNNSLSKYNKFTDVRPSDRRFYKTSTIKPLKLRNNSSSDNLQTISTLDIETATLNYSSASEAGVQIPIIISLSNKELGNKIFTINKTLLGRSCSARTLSKGEQVKG